MFLFYHYSTFFILITTTVIPLYQRFSADFKYKIGLNSSDSSAWDVLICHFWFLCRIISRLLIWPKDHVLSLANRSINKLINNACNKDYYHLHLIQNISDLWVSVEPSLRTTDLEHNDSVMLIKSVTLMNMVSLSPEREIKPHSLCPLKLQIYVIALLTHTHTHTHLCTEIKVCTQCVV